MKIVTLVLATALVAFTAPLNAADAPATPAASPADAAPAAPAAPAKAKAFGGKVTAVTDSSITVSNKKTGDQTFKLDASTKYFGADKAALTAADIKVGAMVRIKPGATPDVASKVMIMAPKTKAPAADASATPVAQ